MFDAVRFGLRLCQPDPSQFRVRIGDRRDQGGIKCCGMAAGNFGCDMSLMGGAVGQHRVTRHIANREHARNIGPARGIDRDNATFVHLDACVFGHDFGAV